MVNIRAFQPNARLIAFVRNPVDVIYSLHSEYYYNLTETEPDFETAWHLQTLRAQGQHVPPRCPDAKMLLYRDRGMLGKQVQRMYSIFPKEQVLLLVYDDFRAAPKDIYEQVLAFLNVPTDNRTDFRVVNASKQYRSRWFGELLQTATVTGRDALYRITGRRLTGSARDVLLGGMKAIRSLNTSKRHRPTLLPEVRQALIKEFSDDIDKLAAIIGRDLSHWKQL